jgi:hypothetical protein
MNSNSAPKAQSDLARSNSHSTLLTGRSHEPQRIYAGPLEQFKRNRDSSRRCSGASKAGRSQADALGVPVQLHPSLTPQYGPSFSMVSDASASYTGGSPPKSLYASKGQAPNGAPVIHASTSVPDLLVDDAAAFNSAPGNTVGATDDVAGVQHAADDNSIANVNSKEGPSNSHILRLQTNGATLIFYPQSPRGDASAGRTRCARQYADLADFGPVRNEPMPDSHHTFRRLQHFMVENLRELKQRIIPCLSNMIKTMSRLLPILDIVVLDPVEYTIGALYWTALQEVIRYRR